MQFSGFKWYYSTWFVAVLFSLWFLIIPLIIGVFLISRQKKELKFHLQNYDQDKKRQIEEYKTIKEEEFESLKMVLFEEEELQKKARINQIEELEDHIQIKQKETARITLLSKLKIVLLEREIMNKMSEAQVANKTLRRKLHQLNRLKRVRDDFTKELIVLKDELLYQSFGFYDLRYDLEDSQEYKEMLDKVRTAQKEAVKDDLAVNHFNHWTLNNNSRKGEAMNKKNIKLTIRSFNNECDAVIHKVKFNNIESAEKKIRKALVQLNKLNSYTLIEITDYYLNLKLEELYLAYEYARKKNEEREEQRRIKELMREEWKAKQELEDRLKILLKEEQHYKNALATYKKQLEYTSNKTMLNEIQHEIGKIGIELKKIDDEKAEIDFRVRNAKAGHVYIISNIGSFGPDVYKIGMTRRLEPLDRIRELGSASVPFTFDVHAMIFSEDAPALESELHKTFEEKRVNKVNNRKEFFRISLKELEEVVRKTYNKPVEFTKLGIAQEYRETMMIEKKNTKKVS
ncbi:DUF4041 domain-containing protein [Falsibacillus pallidus]|uniref:DUF4041 domain-containing protein n=1 Tax=Falsibacillus pallidus TaxID=493781 RepID=UPI003D98B9DC